MSAAYRQKHAVNSKSLKVDPDNRLISRGPRLRLESEMIRDQALLVSGLLVDKIGAKLLGLSTCGVMERY